MGSEEKKAQKRVTVALDSENLERLEKIKSELMTSKSEVIRRALPYLEVILERGNISPQGLETILDLRYRPDNLIFDIGLFQAFLDEIGEGSDQLKEDIRQIGKEFYSEYCDIGIIKPIECLKRLERTNLYTLIVGSDDSFTLVPTIPEMRKFLKVFFEGYLEASPNKGEVRIVHGKIRIKINKRGNETS
ncbi:hypothetical protein AKJ50_02235 [candidate division MSBL1 archaeon SCGC-AAA382A13]|uniref:Ribbon-helix-helix protein CopG domain-containing protein n=1 Tax=candidate division MSBL1 archaeon SCGC-AAA382A13 TaxID=1698279 RepID=A0A133VDS9_9EURY|nr:hypothetical protein AKJ50_02235 [candidate division MSBL1 archaeon SCGC-AAA382A13]